MVRTTVDHECSQSANEHTGSLIVLHYHNVHFVLCCQIFHSSLCPYEAYFIYLAQIFVILRLLPKYVFEHLCMNGCTACGLYENNQNNEEFWKFIYCDFKFTSLISREKIVKNFEYVMKRDSHTGKIFIKNSNMRGIGDVNWKVICERIDMNKDTKRMR